jgi:hypothetical protein|tara:strand:- start:746 stop:1537 length:792 start_codon:yes stop_codon:yes gene_type:complete
MKINNTYLMSVISIIFIVSCADNTNTEVSSNEGPIHQGPYYNEFLACTSGADYSDENAREMLSAWQELSHSDDLLWAGVYAPKGDDNNQDNGWWELQWSSKEAADKAWSSSNPEFIEWSEKYSSVISCDGDGRNPWTFYLPRPADSFGEVEGDDGYFVSEFLACNFNEGKSRSDMRAAVVEYNTYLDGIENGPYFYGVYYPEFAESGYDLLWGNWSSDWETKAAGDSSWLENGQDMQAKFNEVVTCRSPDLYDSWMLLSNTED